MVTTTGYEPRRATGQQRPADRSEQPSRDALELLEASGSEDVQALLALVGRIAPTRLIVLIQGDSGIRTPIEDTLPPMVRLAQELVEHREVEASSGNKGSSFYVMARRRFEQQLVRRMIDRHGGNKKAAAKALGVSYTTVKDKSRESCPGDKLR